MTFDKDARQQLRARAMAATAGAWRSGRSDMVSYTLGDGGEPFKNLYVDDPNGELHLGHRLPRTIGRAQGENCLEDAAYIAAANPQVILALLDALDALEGE